MIEVQLSTEDLEEAKKLSVSMGTLNNSITSGSGNIAGFLGEIAARRLYGGTIKHTYQYDLVLPDGQTADVKTKQTSVMPKVYYDCSVADFNPNQQCDLYIFCRVHYNKKTCWVLGHYDKQLYIQNARFLKKGQLDGDNGFIVKADCYNMMISELEMPDVDRTAAE